MSKICIISPTFSYMNCGVGDYVREFVKFLSEGGTENSIEIITSNHKKIKQFIENEQIKEFTILPVIKHWDIRALFTILKETRRFRPDVIHIQYHWWNFNDGFILKGSMIIFLPLILKILNFRCSAVTTLHSRMNGPYLFPKAGLLRRWGLVLMLTFCDKIIVTNRFDGRSISCSYPFIKNKIVYILGGTGHYLKDKGLRNESSIIRKQLKSSDEEVLLSNFGFMIPYKGLEELLLAMSALTNKGYRLKLLAIGGFDIEVNFAGAYFSKLQKMAASLQLEPFVKWFGFCDYRQASLFLLASDICVMPFTDGASEWRSSFLDALSHGLPIVTTYTEKTPEELIDRNNVILVPPKDHKRLASAIEELINSPALRKSLSKGADELYSNVYDWNKITRKTEEIYRSLIDNSKNNIELCITNSISLRTKIFRRLLRFTD